MPGRGSVETSGQEVQGADRLASGGAVLSAPSATGYYVATGSGACGGRTDCAVLDRGRAGIAVARRTVRSSNCARSRSSAVGVAGKRALSRNAAARGSSRCGALTPYGAVGRNRSGGGAGAARAIRTGKYAAGRMSDGAVRCGDSAASTSSDAARADRCRGMAVVAPHAPRAVSVSASASTPSPVS